MSTLLSAKEHDILQNVIVYLAFTVRNLSKAKLNKLIFLADLYHYSIRGHRLTSVPFLHYHHGPYSILIEQAAMENDGEQIRLEEIESSTKGEILIIKPNVDRTQIKLPPDYIETLKQVVRDWGTKPYKEIVNYAKRTTLFTSTPYKALVKFETIQPSVQMRDVLNADQERTITNFVNKHKKFINASLEAFGIRE